MLALCLLVPLVLAGDAPDVLVVGVHVPTLMGEAAHSAASRVEKALDESGKVDGLSPIEVSRRIRGRESIVLESFAMGPGRERLKEARLLYDRAQIDEAGPVVEEAISMLSGGMAVSTATRELHEALVLLGMTKIAMGDEKSASTSFRRAATLGVERELDPVNYPPRVIELYNAARAEIAKKSPARVTVQTSIGANVFIDGKDLGASPTGEIALVPGEHFVLVRASGGAARFQTITVTPGEQRVVDVALQTQGLGNSASDPSGRSRQIRDLYRAMGDYDDRGTLLLAGSISADQVGVQLYSPTSGNFSRSVTGEAGDDPVDAICELLPTLLGYLAESGDIRADRVGAQVLPLDIGANTVLSGLLVDPPPINESAPNTTVVDKKGVPWWVWAGTGALVAGAGAGVAVVALSSPDNGGGNGNTEPPVDQDQGTIVVGPIP